MTSNKHTKFRINSCYKNEFVCRPKVAEGEGWPRATIFQIFLVIKHFKVNIRGHNRLLPPNRPRFAHSRAARDISCSRVAHFLG